MPEADIPYVAVAPTLFPRTVRLPASLLATFDAHRSLGFTGDLDAWIAEAVAGYVEDRGHVLAYLIAMAIEERGEVVPAELLRDIRQLREAAVPYLGRSPR